MRRTWFFFLIIIPLAQQITLEIDGTIHLGEDAVNMRAKPDKHEPMIDIIIQNNDGKPLAYPENDTKVSKIKHKRSRDHTREDKAIAIAFNTNKRDLDRALIFEEIPRNAESVKHKNRHSETTISDTTASEPQTTETTIRLTKSGMMKDENITAEVYQHMFVQTHKVKQVDKIKNFTNHIYEESMKVFDNVKEKINDYALKKEVEYLRNSYIDKFGNFVRETQDQNVKTKMGHQKVVINTVDTSNRIMARLVNYLMTKIDERPALRNLDTNRILQNQLELKKEKDNKRLCDELKICRAKTSFIDFAIGLLNIIISSDDKQVKQVTNALTEVLKNSDFGNVLDAHSEKRFHRGLNHLEVYDAKTLRALYTMLKNLLVSRNEPLEVNENDSDLAIKTLAFMEVVELWDRALPPTEKSILEWQDITNGFKDWKRGKRNDVQDLVQAFVDQVATSTRNMYKEERVSFEKKMNILLGYK